MADAVLQGIRRKMEGHTDKPCLAVVCVGNRRESDSFVRSKIREAAICGVDVIVKRFEGTIGEQDLLEQVALLNANPSIDGILLQLPLPSHLHELTISQAVSFDKDVDSLHKENLGLLAIPQAKPLFAPCTALSVVKILESTGVQMRGAVVCIIGASANVGIPLMLLLIRNGCTVTLCHIFTRDLAKHTAGADIVVAAAGVSRLIGAEHVRPGAVVVDVGINFEQDASKSSGFRLVGDVDFESVRRLASVITPVPNGVGPMTSALVLDATAEAFLHYRAKRRLTSGSSSSSRPKLELVYPQNSK
jgi:5,10-methylene-tetrahydrofolate dehydrogenase/methenyl tetrahydrofolate cyclohydrolase